jgi:hypothetical protein
MIRRSTFIVLIIAMMAWLRAVPSSSQSISFGVRGGLNIMQMEFDDDIFDNSNRAGFFVGPTLVFSLPTPGFSIDVSGLYDQRYLKVEDQKLKQESVTFPAHVRMGASIPSFGSLFLFLGPQLSFNIGAATFHWEDAEQNAKHFMLQDTKVSVDLGIGASIGNQLEVKINYNIPIGKTADMSWNTYDYQTAKYVMNTAKTTANAWMLSAAYLF